ncbi:MAG: LytR/AlgR family response regulator transcription factor, partial [Gemmatimonadota bacterium]
MTDRAPPLRTLIVDDEPASRRVIRLLLRDDSDIEVIGECRDGHEAVHAIRRDAPDLVFLDVQMPEMDGFEALAALEPERWPLVVFVTAYDSYALRAFDMHAVDYLLKP